MTDGRRARARIGDDRDEAGAGRPRAPATGSIPGMDAGSDALAPRMAAGASASFPRPAAGTRRLADRAFRPVLHVGGGVPGPPGRQRPPTIWKAAHDRGRGSTLATAICACRSASALLNPPIQLA